MGYDHDHGRGGGGGPGTWNIYIYIYILYTYKYLFLQFSSKDVRLNKMPRLISNMLQNVKGTPQEDKS